MNGSDIPAEGIHGGPVLCEQANPNQCYQPSANNVLNVHKNNAPSSTSLQTSVSNLALSVTGLTEFGIIGTPSSGLARVITITNTGSHAAVNLAVTPPTWPAGTSDWYLPAICEMGYGSTACGTSGAPTLQNIQYSLIDSSGLSAPTGYYWSSTEYSINPRGLAWIQLFASGGGSNHFFVGKYVQNGVRCSRALTL